MKRFIYIIIALFATISCGKDSGNNEPDSTFTLNRSDIIGCWKVIQAKFDESATMTAWSFPDTYAMFEENGLYRGSGHFGEGTGTYSVSGNIITAKVDNVPYIVYEVTGLTGERAELTATLQSNQMKIWMVCQKTKAPEQYLEVPPQDVLSTDTFFNSEAAVVSILSSIHEQLALFAEGKLAIEEQLITGKFNALNPENKAIESIWAYLYKSLRIVNIAIPSLEKNDNSYARKYVPAFYALRAFVAYNLATIWGDVPYTKEVQDVSNEIPVWKASAILESAAEDINKHSDDYTIGNVDWFRYFNPMARSLLYGEIMLTLKKKDVAKPYFNINFEDSRFSKQNAIFCFYKSTPESQPVLLSTVYNIEIVKLLQKEVDGKTEGLVDGWKTVSHYGFWQMLKRTGMAQEVTGCKDFQLLFPIPSKEVLSSSNLSQNPGY